MVTLVDKEKIDTEKVMGQIAEILGDIQVEADIEKLRAYRSLFQKGTPLFRRSWVAAWLLMKQIEGGDPRRRQSQGAPRGIQAEFEVPRSDASHEGSRSPMDGQKYPLAEEDSARLFINLGRSKRIFPREILGLIMTATTIPKEDIGAIRILENYSFVQVRRIVADDIIVALNGKPFRGRVLTVNYARNRRDITPQQEDSGTVDTDEFFPLGESSLPSEGGQTALLSGNTDRELSDTEDGSAEGGPMDDGPTN
jgi:hypothetical protein